LKILKRVLIIFGVEDAFKKGLIARILVILCLLFIVFGAVFVAIRILMTLLPFFPDAHWTDFLIESVIFMVGMIVLWLIRSDKLKTASRVILSGLFFVVSLQAYFLGDPANDIAGAMGLLLFVFLAILLLDGWDRLIATLLAIAVFIGLNVLASTGSLIPAITLSPLGKIIFSFFVWVSVGVIITIVTIAAMGAMRREPHLLEQKITGFTKPGMSGQNQKGLSYLSTHDELTGLYNRLFFEAESARLEKSRFFPISIITAEIEDLKQVNDKFGKGTGDQVLINVARLFSKVFRQEDIITRYGGDDFAILLPGADVEILKAVIKRITTQIEGYNKRYADLPLKIIMGVSTANKGESLNDHLKLAHAHLNYEKLSRIQK
jgi:diguanylate cyclase (GGDEF)-like protein